VGRRCRPPLELVLGIRLNVVVDLFIFLLIASHHFFLPLPITSGSIEHSALTKKLCGSAGRATPPPQVGDACPAFPLGTGLRATDEYRAEFLSRTILIELIELCWWKYGTVKAALIFTLPFSHLISIFAQGGDTPRHGGARLPQSCLRQPWHQPP
jgi:hypothetical protein